MIREVVTAGMCLAVAACASAGGRMATSPTDHMAVALAALDRNELPTALDHLRTIVAAEPGGSLERQARLLAAAIALDPRNPARDPKLGAELAAGHQARAGEPWEAVLAQSLYALALDLGARPDAKTLQNASAPLPTLPARPLAIRLRDLESTVAQLQEELKRIRETLKP